MRPETKITVGKQRVYQFDTPLCLFQVPTIRMSKKRGKQPPSAGVHMVLDRGIQKQAKICVVCNRPFTWRKKWERCWDEVLTCSDKCKKQRKQKSPGQKGSTDEAQEEN